MQNISRFREFVRTFTDFIEREGEDNEERVFTEGKQLLKTLVEHDDWLPDAFAQPNPDKYQQYLLYCDPKERFSIVSFVWGPGQTTPIHDHTVWGMVGVLRGAEMCEEFETDSKTGQLQATHQHHLPMGGVDLVSPTIGDIHKVSNAHADSVSVSIHIYGANIGAVSRHTYDPETGKPATFISGYSSTVMPNLWDRSVESLK